MGPVRSAFSPSPRRRGTRSEWDTRRVRDTMIPLDQVPLLTEDERAVDALTELSAPRANRAPRARQRTPGRAAVDHRSRASARSGSETGPGTGRSRLIAVSARRWVSERAARKCPPGPIPSPYGLTGADVRENVARSKPGDRKVGGLRHFFPYRYGRMPSLRSSTSAARRQRIVSGENGSVYGIPFALRSGSPPRSGRVEDSSRGDFDTAHRTWEGARASARSHPGSP
jgi:hypothetical protein